MNDAAAPRKTLLTGNVVLPDKVLASGGVLFDELGKIALVGPAAELAAASPEADVVNAGDGYIAPGMVDLHVHGGAGADFMDGTREAFRTVLAAHARHGTTSLCPTTTVASHHQLLAVLQLCRAFRTGESTSGAQVLGAHFYGPYFAYEARGCHPGSDVRPPIKEQYDAYLEYANSITNATVAPELPGAEAFARACRELGIVVNVGHSLATFPQMAAAVDWGARHVDHLYCAMSDKSKLRQQQAYPMQGGVLEATLYFDELTTEIIADGKHLTGDLMLLAHKIKGPDMLALATDCNRALDLPEGEYLFGPLDGGETFLSQDGVGVMPDGKALASSVQGMDHMLRTFIEMTGLPIYEAVRMATLTPARIAGHAQQIGSLEPNKQADILIFDQSFRLQRIWIRGVEYPYPGERAGALIGSAVFRAGWDHLDWLRVPARLGRMPRFEPRWLDDVDHPRARRRHGIMMRVSHPVPTVVELNVRIVMQPSLPIVGGSLAANAKSSAPHSILSPAERGEPVFIECLFHHGLNVGRFAGTPLAVRRKPRFAMPTTCLPT